MTVTVDLARELLDFGARLRTAADHGANPPQAEEQLRGAVAIHNILEREGVAYLADEVGMGKTYVALGAIALFRHFDPTFRVAVIAPRENIQTKWMKEWFNFATYIVRILDLRVKALHGGPARPLAKCDSLRHFIRESSIDPDRDFFLRMSSFSLAAGKDESDLREVRRVFRQELPWLSDDLLQLRSKKEFKDNLAKGLCCAIPEFDLLVVDEAHNLKYGFSDRIAARNRVIAFMFGRESDEVDLKSFPNYGRRAKRVLMLSATPVEDDYRQLWNQLDVLGRGEPYRLLSTSDATEDEKKAVAKRFLIRRVTAMESDGQRLTKNLYRQEWRRGGLILHDEPIKVEDVRQRLVVALVQKKVAELLNSPRFNATFQMGMLASFESFLQTAKLKKSDEELGNFDDVEQTDNELEREGIDVGQVNRLADDFRQRFHEELPHPKMDALVEKLSRAWVTGRKALVFFRRVASVWEVKERLDLAYNNWLANRLQAAFAADAVLAKDWEELLTLYKVQRGDRQALLAARSGRGTGEDDEQDRGGLDTLFAWFFRGDGPAGRWLSGAKFSQRFGQAGLAVSTVFEDNYVSDLLGAVPGEVQRSFAAAVGSDESAVEEAVAEAAAWYLTRRKKPGRRDLFEAAQAGGVDVLRTQALSPDVRKRAECVWRRVYESRRRSVALTPVANATRELERPTFFTAIREPRWEDLRREIWPTPSSEVFDGGFLEQELRRELLSRAARLGHAVIDLYALAMSLRGTLRTGPASEEAEDIDTDELALKYLEWLDRQRAMPVAERGWGAYDELAEIGKHFELILDVNEPQARSASLEDVGGLFGSLLRQQQPTGGMTGQVNKTLVRQFRMPGYPLVLLSTDLLQEGEDLHTFCADIYHYGIAWTPSATEQRIGRIDRVRSKTERTVSNGTGPLAARDKLQVYYPHLEDTVERLQVRRVLRRMAEFVRLMHEGLGASEQESSRLNVATEILDLLQLPPPILTPLETAFPVLEQDTRGQRRVLAVTASDAEGWSRRLAELRDGTLGDLAVNWDAQSDGHSLIGTAPIGQHRRQPFALHLQSHGDRLIVRCASHVGDVDDEELTERLKDLACTASTQVGLLEDADDEGFGLTVEAEVLLGDKKHDRDRVAWLVRRVVEDADRLEMALWPELDKSVDESRESLQSEGKVQDNADRSR